MYLTLDLDTLLEGGHGILEELLLLVVLLPDVWIYVAILALLVLDVRVQELLDGDLQLLVVVDVIG